MVTSSIIPTEITIFFNFRSPYCYLASKRMFAIFEKYHTKIIWKPLGGWSGRSAPERAAIKIPLVRQDIERSARKLGIPFIPPPIDTDPTLAGAISLVAEQEGVLEQYVQEVMQKEWAEGKNIGEIKVLLEVGEEIGLDRELMLTARNNEALLTQMSRHWVEAQSMGVFGVPTFLVDDQMFWGNDRIYCLKDHLDDLKIRKI